MNRYQTKSKQTLFLEKKINGTIKQHFQTLKLRIDYVNRNIKRIHNDNDNIQLYIESIKDFINLLKNFKIYINPDESYIYKFDIIVALEYLKEYQNKRNINDYDTVIQEIIDILVVGLDYDMRFIDFYDNMPSIPLLRR